MAQTILYIEDDPGSQMLIQRALTHLGYRVLVASRGVEGLDLAFQHIPDLVLVDINLPDLSGREVTTRLRSDERFQNVPIVALTALGRKGEREKAIVAGMDGFLTKPVDIDLLPDQIAHYLRGGRDMASRTDLSEAQIAYNQELVIRLEAKIRELERSNEELRRLDKIKEGFIQLSAHELRTPMTLIYGYSRLLQSSPVVQRLRDESPEVNAFMDGLVEAIERMASIINEILTISRIATGRVQLSIGPVNPAQVVTQVVQTYQPIVQQRNQSLSFDVEEVASVIQADSDLLALAVSNLVSNAIKYTPDGGAININGRKNGACVLITVQDTGIGISKDEQKRIFERFYTAGNVHLHSSSKTAFHGGGLGLGLSICRGIIEAHGGRIWVESAGRDEKRLPGSTFFVELPLQARAGDPKATVTL